MCDSVPYSNLAEWCPLSIDRVLDRQPAPSERATRSRSIMEEGGKKFRKKSSSPPPATSTLSNHLCIHPSIMGDTSSACDDFRPNVPCSCIFCKNLMMTLLLGRINTCRRPRFSALDIVLRQSARTDMRTIYYYKVYTMIEWWWWWWRCKK